MSDKTVQLISLRNDVLENLEKTYLNEQQVKELGLEKCEEQFHELLVKLAAPPAFTTLRINPRVASGDKDAVIQLVREEIEKQYLRKGWLTPEIIVHPTLTDVLVISNRGPNLDPIQTNYKEVIVDHDCGMAVLRGADVFVQGIMGAHQDLQAGDSVVVYADIDGVCRRGMTQTFTGNKKYVGSGVMRASREQIFVTKEKISGVGVEMTQPLYEAPSLYGVLSAYIFPQNLPSIVCSRVLDPKPGETILDMCAAPGGKTVHIATLMNNIGRVVALDKTPQKVEKVAKNAATWGITCIETYPFDSTQAVDEAADVSGPPPYPQSSFDRVLLDGPCSAFGQRPCCKNRMTLNTLKSYSTYQRKFIEKAVQLLKPGGVLVYSTCTITLDENERQVAWTLQNCPELSLEEQVPHLGGHGMLGSTMKREELQKLQRFDPTMMAMNHDQVDVNLDTIGFFIAKFRKIYKR
ncbi:hypothetical protein CHS0354_019715 [Potamilus streckersoni]|uniref:SAM-dependent MTase RsmB/NOP-type domain-containing protein n=1 Tax=Potamilus streckersoni TaxID=2493646 RepID=A0AAE0SAK2_9BIVA|nr:hypothetical protein CHS0354_019715 [Potamilus streckersoni]